MTSTARLLPATALLLLGLSGCALSNGSGATAGEGRDAMYDVLSSTQLALGGPWTRQDDPTSRGCVIPLWVEGTQYPALRLGPAPRNAERAAEAVTEVWTALGYEVTRTEVAGVIEVKGSKPLGELLILRVGEDSMTLQGESECRPRN